MTIRPIRNDADLTAALERIEELWGAAAGTAAGDELEVLSVLVEHYELAHHDIPVSDPIEVLQLRIKDLGLSKREVARRSGIGSGRLSELLAGKRRLTPAHVWKLASALGLPARLLTGTAVPADGSAVVSVTHDLVAYCQSAAAVRRVTVDAWVCDLIRGHRTGRVAPAAANRRPALAA